MGGKKKQKKKQATSRRTAKQTAQKPKTQTSRSSSKQEPKQTSKASSKANTPNTSNNQTSKANNKTTSKQEPKQTSKANNKATSKQEPKQEAKQTLKQESKQEAKQEKQSDKDKSAEQVEETKQASADIEVVIKKHNDSNNGHPHVILEDFDGDKHVSVGLTTRKLKGKNATNYKLEKDPLGEVEESYMRRQGTVDYQKNYFEPRKGKLTKKDYERALLYGQRAKEKYLKKQQEKKKT